MSKSFFALPAAIAALCLTALPVRADVVPCALFSDHTVLQRDVTVPVWGKADPGEAVTVTLGGFKPVSATADASGKWMAKLPRLTAGGPYTLTISGKNSLTINDVMVGDVWIVSGQSNITYTLGSDRTYNAPEIADAADPRFRMITIPTNPSLEPQSNTQAAWSVADSQSVPGWSAVGFYFGRDLRKELGVPIGIIHASSGGTDGETWVSLGTLEKDPLFAKTSDDKVAALKRFPEESAAFPGIMDAWLKANGAEDTGNTGFAQGWAKPEFDDGSWRTVNISTNLASLGFKGGATVWFRRSFDFTPDANTKDFYFGINWVYGAAPTMYFNGVEVPPVWSAAPYKNAQYTYFIHKEMIRANQPNTVALRLHCPSQDSGWWAQTQDMGLPVADPKALSQAWKFQVEKQFPNLSNDAKASLPQYPSASPTFTASTLFNGQINPLIPYAIKGVVWYQGENNVSRSDQYRQLLTDLIADWRSHWAAADGSDRDAGFPFLIEQLANYYDVPDHPVNSGVAGVREAQLQVSRTVPDTGLAVAIDIGEENIHPRNKREVGRRLCLLAMAKAYGKKVVYSGPIYAGDTVEGNQIRIKFTQVNGGLVAQGGPLKQFAIAGDDKKWVWADAKIDGDTVVVSSPQVAHPTQVRYAWANNPQGCNLYNAAGLPASPFRTDTWPNN